MRTKPRTQENPQYHVELQQLDAREHSTSFSLYQAQKKQTKPNQINKKKNRQSDSTGRHQDSHPHRWGERGRRPGVSSMLCSSIAELLHEYVRFVKIHNLCFFFCLYVILQLKSLLGRDWLFITYTLECQFSPEGWFPSGGHQKTAFDQSNVGVVTRFPTQLHLYNKKQPERSMSVCWDCVSLGKTMPAFQDTQAKADNYSGTLNG